MTLTFFNKLYLNYKNDFDMELRLKQANMTYAEAYKKSQEDEEWLK